MNLCCEQITKGHIKLDLKLDFGCFNSVFAVPCSVVDTHIKLAGSVQLKVLLYFLRHAGENLSIDDVASALSLSCADVKDALQYWIETNLMSEILKNNLAENNINSQKNIKNNLPLNKEKSENLNLRKKVVSTRPDNKSIARRIDESEEIKYLMQEAQIILSRPISNSDSATLLMLHDVDGLPVDVILMLLQYAVSIGKCNLRYIEKVAMSWGEEEINTIEKAEEKIKNLENYRMAWNKVRKVLGIDGRAPTQKEAEAANRWLNEWNFSEDLIKEAYDRCVDLKGKYILNYIDSIIKRWKSSGIDTLEKALVEKNNKTFKSNSDISPSYNIESYFDTMDTFV